MKEGRASRTALYAAGFRAVENVRSPANSRLFEDPYACHFLDSKLRRYVRLAATPIVGGIARDYIELMSAGAMSSGIARTRLIDDYLLDSLKNGISQVVLLGAGYDCRPYRLKELKNCSIVEIDHPSTQAAKVDGLKRIMNALPGHVQFLGADLAVDELELILQSSNLELKRPIFIIWEGVTHYIGGAAVDKTLQTLSRLAAAGSRLVFTYIHNGLLDGSVDFEKSRIPLKRVTVAGEPWIYGLNPAILPAYLKSRGFSLIEDLGADDYRTRYWGGAGAKIHGFSFYRAALAEVDNHK